MPVLQRSYQRRHLCAPVAASTRWDGTSLDDDRESVRRGEERKSVSRSSRQEHERVSHSRQARANAAQPDTRSNSKAHKLMVRSRKCESNGHRFSADRLECESHLHSGPPIQRSASPHDRTTMLDPLAVIDARTATRLSSESPPVTGRLKFLSHRPEIKKKCQLQSCHTTSRRRDSPQRSHPCREMISGYAGA